MAAGLGQGVGIFETPAFTVHRPIESLRFDDDGGATRRARISLLARRALLASVAGIALISDGSRGAGISLVTLVALCALWPGRAGDYSGSGNIASTQSEGQR